MSSSPASSSDNSSTTLDGSASSTTQFSPSMAIILVVLLSAFFFMGFFSIYVKRCTGEDDNPAGFNTRRNPGGTPTTTSSLPQQGLDAAIVRALPLIAYSTSKKRGTNVDCVVCLLDFDDGEIVRQLPKCKHVFHPDCIDMWLYSHTTCPLCRRGVAGESAHPSFRWGGGSGSIRLWGSGRQSAGPSTPTEGSVAGGGGRVVVVVTETPPAATPEISSSPSPVVPTSRQPSLPRSHSTGHSVLKRAFSRTHRPPLSSLVDIPVFSPDLQRSRTVAGTGYSADLSAPLPVARYLKRALSLKSLVGPSAAAGPSAEFAVSHAVASGPSFERLV